MKTWWVSAGSPPAPTAMVWAVPTVPTAKSMVFVAVPAIASPDAAWVLMAVIASRSDTPSPAWIKSLALVTV